MLVTSFLVVFPIENVKADLTTGLVGYWSFDDGTATDLSGYGNHGTMYGNPTSTTGISGSALSFDGIDDWIDCGNDASLNPSTAITLSAWYKTTVSWYGLGNDPIIDKPYTSHTSPYYQYHLGVCGDLNPGGSMGIEYDVATDGVWNYICTGPDIITFGEWCFLVGTYDGNTMKFYFNGQLFSSKAVSGTISDYGQNLSFAKYNVNNLATYLPGVIDEIRIYNRALSESDIQELYSQVIQVQIDIKPGSYPNTINPKSKGKVPVAILTTEHFNASMVNPDSIVFLSASPFIWTLEDVDKDGDIDLLLLFKTQELNFSLLVDEGDEYPYAYLTGKTISGGLIEGKDTVRLVGQYTLFKRFLERFIQLFPIFEKILNQII